MEWQFEDEITQQTASAPVPNAPVGGQKWAFEDELIKEPAPVIDQPKEPKQWQFEDEIPTARDANIATPIEPDLGNKANPNVIMSTTIPEKVDIPFSAKHPNLYALGMTPIGTAKELSKVSWLKYIYPEERKKLTELSQQTTEGGSNLGTRQLLFDTLEAVTLGNWKPITQGAKALLKAQLPKTYTLLFETQIGGKGGNSVIQKIAKHKSENKGKPPEKKVVDNWVKEAEGKPVVVEKPIKSYTHDEATIQGEAKKLGVGIEFKGTQEGFGTIKPVELYNITSGPAKGATIGFRDFSPEGISSKIKESVNSFVIKEDPLLATIKGKPTTEAPQKYAQSVNLEKQNISLEAKKLELDMAGQKKTQSWDKTGELSEGILKDAKKTDAALKKIKGLEGLTENMEVVRKANVNQISNLAKMADDVTAGSMTEDEFNVAFSNIRENFFKVTSEGSSEIGRALNAHKKILSETDHLTKGLAKIEKGLNSKQISEFAEVIKGGNPAKMARFAAELKDPKLKDYILEYWYNSILSGPPTHAVNMISNSLWAGYQVPHRVHTALWDKLYSTVTGKERTRLVREVIPMFAGYKTGVKRGAKSAMETLKTGAIQDFETKWAQEVGVSSIGAWERSPYKWMRKLAPAVSAFTRALRAEDVFMNAIAYDGEMLAIATRNGIKKGFKGKQLKNFITEFAKHPTDEAHAQAMKFSKHSTFMDDPDKMTEWFLKLRKVPVAGPASQFVVPFVNTIGNLTKRGLEFTPGVGIAKEVISRKMGRGMSTPEVIAKQVEGSMLALYMLYKSDAGEVVGAAPQNKAERERFYAQGKQPWSVRLGGKMNKETGEREGGTWVSYRRIEPFNTVFANTAIVYDKLKNAKDDDSRMKIFGQIVGDLKNNLIDSSYFQGLQQVFNRHQKVEEAPQRFTGSFVPYSSFWRSMNRAYEKATLGDVKLREKGTWLSALAHVILGLSGKVPAELNIWGDEIVIPGSILQHWLPYKWSKETNDPVEIELEKINKDLKNSPTGLKVYPGQPMQTIKHKGKKIKLSDDVYRDYLIDLGRELRASYEKAMGKTSYILRSSEQKAKILNRRTSKARNKIRSKLLRKITKEKNDG